MLYTFSFVLQNQISYAEKHCWLSIHLVGFSKSTLQWSPSRFCMVKCVKFPWVHQRCLKEAISLNKEQIPLKDSTADRVFLKMTFHLCPSGCGRFLCGSPLCEFNISFPNDEELSITASEDELLSSKAEDSPGLSPSGVTTQAECDRVGSSTIPGSHKH